MAKDIKYNLRSQTDKLENKTLKNLFNMQRDMVKSNRLILMIKRTRMKNKCCMWGIIILLIFSVSFIFYMSVAGGGSEQNVVVQKSDDMQPEPSNLGEHGDFSESFEEGGQEELLE